MVSGIDLAECSINRMVRDLLSDGVTVREVNTALMTSTVRLWIDEVGEDTLRHVLVCTINQIDEGAYREGYVSPEARMLDEEEAQQRRSSLTVIDGGGRSKV